MVRWYQPSALKSWNPDPADHATWTKSVRQNYGGTITWIAKTLDEPVVSAENVASTGKIKLGWDKVEGVVKYEVYRATSMTGTYTKLTTVTGTSV